MRSCASGLSSGAKHSPLTLLPPKRSLRFCVVGGLFLALRSYISAARFSRDTSGQWFALCCLEICNARAGVVSDVATAGALSSAACCMVLFV